MRRLVALFLLVLLPLQAVWAAAAPYCQHEGDVASRHIGHHEPEHGQHAAVAAEAAEAADAAHAPHTGAATGEAGDEGLGGDAHSDCHVCHGGTVLTHVVQTLQWASTPSLLAPEPARGQPAPPGERPERPKWPALA